MQGAMKVNLDTEDWERIVHALSQFAHNPEFRATLTRVLALRERLK